MEAEKIVQLPLRRKRVHARYRIKPCERCGADVKRAKFFQPIVCDACRPVWEFVRDRGELESRDRIVAGPGIPTPIGTWLENGPSGMKAGPKLAFTTPAPAEPVGHTLVDLDAAIAKLQRDYVSAVDDRTRYRGAGVHLRAKLEDNERLFADAVRNVDTIDGQLSKLIAERHALLAKGGNQQ